MGSKLQHSASKRILGLLVSWPLLLSAFAQQPNQWRGLTLHQSTMRDAVAKLGKPKKIRENQKFQTVLDEFVDKSKRYAKLEYRRLEKMKGANLYFLDGKLEIIELTLEQKINPNRLEEIYQTPFSLLKTTGALCPETEEGELYSEIVPVIYDLFGKTEHSYIVARVKWGVFSQIEAGTAGRDSGDDLCGEVDSIQLISTSLER